MFSRRHGPCPSMRKARDFSFGNHPAFTATILYILLLSAHGCGVQHPQNVQSPDLSSQKTKFRYTDGIGRTVDLSKHPTRIVSLAPSVTEILYMLGAQDRLIGVTTQCDWPDEAKAKPKIGDLLSPNYEVILALKPDLIIASTAGNDRAAVLKLADLNVPVFVTAPRSVEKIFETVSQIGTITDCAEQAERLNRQMKERLSAISQRLQGVPPVRAFFITWFDPLLAPGKNTFENDALKLAGVDSISASIDDYYPKYSLEQVISQDPEAILTVEHSGNPLPNLKQLAGWKQLRAVQAGRVYVLDAVLQHPSPRFMDGIEELVRKLHPERMP
jgi:iron complex transport system substrate-binding protein